MQFLQDDEALSEVLLWGIVASAMPKVSNMLQVVLGATPCKKIIHGQVFFRQQDLRQHHQLGRTSVGEGKKRKQSEASEIRGMMRMHCIRHKYYNGRYHTLQKKNNPIMFEFFGIREDSIARFCRTSGVICPRLLVTDDLCLDLILSSNMRFIHYAVRRRALIVTSSPCTTARTHTRTFQTQREEKKTNSKQKTRNNKECQ